MLTLHIYEFVNVITHLLPLEAVITPIFKRVATKTSRTFLLSAVQRSPQSCNLAASIATLTCYPTWLQCPTHPTWGVSQIGWPQGNIVNYNHLDSTPNLSLRWDFIADVNYCESSISFDISESRISSHRLYGAEKTLDTSITTNWPFVSHLIRTSKVILTQ